MSSHQLLTKSQQALLGRNVWDMSVLQLHDWIAACDTMERSVKANKVRRSWKHEQQKAMEELRRRGAADGS